MLMRSIGSVLLALAAALVLAACGDDSQESADAPAVAEGAASPAGEVSAAEAAGHIHGLGVNPRDGALIIATHFGLFRAAKGSTDATRVGDSQQDVMGFSVQSPDRFLGSGHPAPDQADPPLLGLIESRDAGSSWKPISLRGEADFHVLRSAGSRVYGFDSSQGRLMVSGDRGRSWSQRTPPGPLLDLAVDPGDSQRAVASTGEDIVVTRDTGKGWRQLRANTAGLLAWPSVGRLYLVDAAGALSVSGDGGTSWRDTGEIGGPPVALAADGDALYAALQDGAVKQSVDGGQTWSVRAALR